jgi:hypothetical protein
MGILDSVTSAVPKEGIRAVIAGVEGIGKTTFACGAPRPLLVPLEDGLPSGLIVNKTPKLDKFPYVTQLLDEIIASITAGQFQYQSIVIDSATALERLIHNTTLATDPLYIDGNKKGLIMDNALGGYGKAYNYANSLFEGFLGRCDYLSRVLGINIILTCHVFASKQKDPTAGEYDQWDLLMHSPKNEKNHGKREMITQWADLVGFMYEPIFVVEGEGNKMSKAVSQNKGRILACNRTPSFVAKNRYKIASEIAVPVEQGWNHLAKAIYDGCKHDVFNRDVVVAQ